MVIALSQLLGFSAWNSVACAKDTAFDALVPVTDAPASFQARNIRYSAPAIRRTCCAIG
jgi:hypothetical protein